MSYKLIIFLLTIIFSFSANIESLICSNDVKDCGKGIYVTRNSLEQCACLVLLYLFIIVQNI